MRLISIAIVTVLLATAANAAMFHLDTDSSLYSATPGTIATVTVTMTTLAETVLPLSGFGITVRWNPTVVKVAGSNPPLTFGRSSQSPVLTGLVGSPTPACASGGPNKGKACAMITQVNATSGLVLVLAPGTIVTGTLLLEVVPGALPGSPLGLAVSGYLNNTLTNPATDPNFSVGTNFLTARLVPEPATGALLALGLVSLGLAGRHRARVA